MKFKPPTNPNVKPCSECKQKPHIPEFVLNDSKETVAFCSPDCMNAYAEKVTQ